MPLVKVLGKGLVKFPDSMGPDQIKSALSSRFGAARKVLDTNDFLYEFDPRTLKATEQGKNIDDYKGDVTKPITVTQTDSGFAILDGHHRAEIAKRDGEKIKAVVIPKTDAEEMASKGVHQGDMLKEWIASDGPKRNQGFTIESKKLASAAPVAIGLGSAGALITPEQAEAANIPPASTGTIEAAQAPAFLDIANALRKVDLPVVGNPLLGLADWAEGVAFQDEDKLKRAAIGALDLL